MHSFVANLVLDYSNTDVEAVWLLTATDIVSVRGLEKERWIRENDRCGGLCKKRPQKLNDGSRFHCNRI
jgi:hypothetical protein